jgi:hypothetical protein
MSKLPWYAHYIPNTTTDLAMIHRATAAPDQPYWTMRITQLIGGKTWSISLIKHGIARRGQRNETDPECNSPDSSSSS